MLFILCICVTLAALAGLFNNKVLQMPPAIGITLISSVAILALEIFGIPNGFGGQTLSIVKSINFYDFLLNGILGFLLFASAIKIDVSALKNYWRQISLLATVGVFFTALLIAVLLSTATSLLGVELPFIYCFLFGAIIAPTDPIAALAVLKSAKAPQSLEMKLAGEALFNDGTAIVMYLTIFGIAIGTSEFSLLSVSGNLLKEIVGAVLFGGAFGWTYSLLLSRKTDVVTMLMFTISLCLASYSGASQLHLSAPISVVVSGLFAGQALRKNEDHHLHEHVNLFWEFLEEVMNISLFVLMGMEIILVKFTPSLVVAGVIAFAIVCTSRLLGIVLTMIPLRKHLLKGTIPLLSWGGIRGGISLALALAVSQWQHGETILAITFITVMLSGLVQGLTLKRVIAYFYPNKNAETVWYERFSDTIGLSFVIAGMTALTDKLVNSLLRLKASNSNPHGTLVDAEAQGDDAKVSNKGQHF